MSIQMSEVMAVVHRHVPQSFSPKAAIILGSGLSSLAEQMSNVRTIPYQAIPGLQTGAVAGHASLLAAGELNGVPVVCLRGRLHLYEGVSPEAVRTLVRIPKHMGCTVMVVTGAVGSMREDAGAGEVMMLTDHMNFQGTNPLLGKNDESEGPRFMSMDDAYDRGLQDAMEAAAGRAGVPLHKGVYCSVLGPSFETPAEIRAFRMLGADVVGMSVVPEVIAARHCGMKVAGLTAITNAAAGLSNEKITHEGTLQFGEVAARKINKIIPEFLKEITANAMV